MLDTATRLMRHVTHGFSRRDFFGAGVLAALASLLHPRAARASTWKASTYSNNVYTRLLGVKPHLPGHEHTTVVGGSRMTAEVMRAMAEAGRSGCTWRVRGIHFCWSRSCGRVRI